MWSSARFQLAGVLIRRDARLLRPHVVRGLLVGLLWLVVWTFSEQSWRQAAGRDLLTGLAFLSALLLVVAAMDAFNSLFTDDWTGPNLELLRMTGLSAFDLLVAKSLPHALGAFWLLLLQVPFALVTVTLGGVTLTQVAAVGVQLAVIFAAASGCAAIWGAISATGRMPLTVARLMTLLTISLYVICATGIDQIVADIRGVRWAGGWFAGGINPVMELVRVLSSGFRGPAIDGTLFVHALAIGGLFRGAWQTLDGGWRAPPTESTPDVPQPAELEAPPLWRPVTPPPRCTQPAIVWKEFYFTLGGPEMLVGKWTLLITVSPLVLLMTATMDRSDQGWLILIGIIGLLGCVASIAFTARRLWQTELREQTLWGLALLPLSAEEVIVAKLQALARVSAPEIVVLSIATLLPLRYGLLEATALLGGVFASLPLIVCTDTGWRFIDSGWEGLTARVKLVGVVLATWSVSAMVGCVHPIAGLFTVILIVPFACWLAIDEAAKWFAWRAGEMLDR